MSLSPSVGGATGVQAVRLAWNGKDSDFGFVCVPSDEVEDMKLTELRVLICGQFSGASVSQDNESTSTATLQSGAFAFVYDGLTVTQEQEKLISVSSFLPRVLLSKKEVALPRLDDVEYVGRSHSMEMFGHGHPYSAEIDPSDGATELAELPKRRDTSPFLPFASGTHHVVVTVPSSTSTTSKHDDGLVIRVQTSGGNEEFVPSMKEMLDNLDSYKSKRGGIVWIDIQGFSDDDIYFLGHKVKLHPLTVEDIVSSSTRQKIEGFSRYMLVILHALHGMQDCIHEIEDVNVSVLIFDQLVISLHRQELFPMKLVQSRIKKVYADVIPSTAAAIHAIVDCMVDSDVEIVASAVREVHTLEDLVYMLSQYEQSDLLKRMGLVRRRLTVLRQKMWPRRDILVNLMNKEWRKFIKGVRVAYFRDVYDHVLVMIQKLEMSTEMLSSLQSTYLAKVSIEVAEASNNVDEIMKKLSSVATILLPMTFITSLFGMNVKVPFQTSGDGADTVNAFWGIVVLMIAISLPIYIWLRRRNCV